MRYTVNTTPCAHEKGCCGMSHAVPSTTMLFIQAKKQGTTFDSVERQVLLTLEQTQGRYTLLLEIHPKGSRSAYKTTGENQWSCFVLEGAFAFEQEGNAQERCVANQGAVIALPSAAAYHYELSGGAQRGQLLIFQFPTAAEGVHQRALRQANEGPSFAVLTDIGTFLLSSEDTGGAYILMLWHVPPQGGPAIHSQSGQETFLVLEGDFAFHGLTEGQPYTIKASKGDVIHAQHRTPHSYQNTGSDVGKMLVVMSPAGRSQKFFQEIGQALGEKASISFPTLPVTDLDTLLKIIKKYDVGIFP